MYLIKLVVLFFSEYIPRSGTAESYDSSIFRFLRNFHLGYWYSSEAAPSHTPTNSAQGYPFSYTFPIFIFRGLFDESHYDRCEVVSHCFDLQIKDRSFMFTKNLNWPNIIRLRRHGMTFWTKRIKVIELEATINIISLPVHRIITECEALFGQWGLACCSPWGCKESDMTEQMNWTELMRLFYLNTEKYVLLWENVLAFPTGNETCKQVLSNWKK